MTPSLCSAQLSHLPPACSRPPARPYDTSASRRSPNSKWAETHLRIGCARATFPPGRERGVAGRGRGLQLA
eukprot:744431-Rhodomonas_salina.1